MKGLRRGVESDVGRNETGSKRLVQLFGVGASVDKSPFCQDGKEFGFGFPVHVNPVWRAAEASNTNSLVGKEGGMSGHQENWTVGCMSGTSVDGVDVAAVATDGTKIQKLGATQYRSFSPKERTTIMNAFGCWQGDGPVAAAEAVVEAAHRSALRDFMPGATLGFHGQTLAHDPDAGRTHQAGNGDKLAHATGRRVVWDFRSSDMACGGQGAPMASFFHFALANFLGMSNPVAFLNLGGVANVSVVDPTFSAPDEEGALFAFDTGPANAIIDDFIRSRTGMPCDLNGQYAISGTPDMNVVGEVLDNPWFCRIPPKSLDRNGFSLALEKVDEMSVQDGAATLTACVAAATRRSFSQIDQEVGLVLVCGGGRLNPELMRRLGQELPATVVPVEEFGLDGTMIEAQAFAHLAARAIRGLPTSCPGTTGCGQPVCGGRISDPPSSGVGNACKD